MAEKDKDNGGDGTNASGPVKAAATVARASIGRIVHFVGDNDAHQAAIVSRINADGSVCLTVFPGEGVRTVGIARYSETPLRGSWHWPERE